MDTASPVAPPPAGLLHRLVAVLAGAAHLVLLVPFTVASGLLAPLWAIVALVLLWGGGAIVFVRLARRRPLLLPVVPPWSTR